MNILSRRLFCHIDCNWQEKCRARNQPRIPRKADVNANLLAKWLQCPIMDSQPEAGVNRHARIGEVVNLFTEVKAYMDTPRRKGNDEGERVFKGKPFHILDRLSHRSLNRRTGIGEIVGFTACP